jgi:hypothetical protein
MSFKNDSSQINNQTLFNKFVILSITFVWATHIAESRLLFNLVLGTISVSGLLISISPSSRLDHSDIVALFAGRD